MTKPNSGLFQFHLRVRTDLPVTSSSLSLFPSLQAWRPTWSLAGRWSLTLTVAVLSWGWLGLSMPILGAPLPGRTHLMEPLQPAPCLQTVLRWVHTISEKFIWNISHVVEEESIFLGSFFIARQYCLRKNTELHVLLQPLWCSSLCSLCTFVYVGVSEDLVNIFHFLHAMSFLWSQVEEEKKKKIGFRSCHYHASEFFHLFHVIAWF